MQNRGIDRTVLKWIAMITMLIDHIGYGLIPDTTPALRALATACNIIGRSAFPIFLFLLADGFMRTRSKPKFFLRLFILAVISEVPFDLVRFGQPFNIHAQNVFWTLLIFFGYMWVSDLLITSAKAHGLSPTNKWTICAHVFAVIMAFSAATILLSDYLGVGVFSGILMYHSLLISQNNPTFQDIPVRLLGYTFGVANLALIFGGGFYALPTILLIWAYQGKCEIKMPKWIGYAFYPAHLSVIAFVMYLQGRVHLPW
ncbi:MAG: hypothetical protein IKO32_02795 [Lachnospiraceae bacterium]|nr:hypothetical protein [Lachnospiraceae bacterium]